MEEELAAKPVVSTSLRSRPSEDTGDRKKSPRAGYAS